jgi:hypothetical protein
MLWPVVKQVTDGHAATEIGLQLNATSLKIPPATRTATHVTYQFQGPSGSKTVTFEKEPEGQGPRKVANADGDVTTIGNIFSLDLRLGAYNDLFRVTFEPTQKLLSFSARARGSGGATGGYGMTVNLADAKGMKLLASDGRSIQLDLNGDGKSDIAIFDGLSAPDRVNPEAKRRHTIRITGAIGADRTLSFELDGQHTTGYQSGNQDADKTAASNATAVDGLKDQAALGTYIQNIDAFEGAMVASRFKAAQDKLISQALLDAWADAAIALIQLRAELAGNRADPSHVIAPATIAAAATAATKFFTELAATTKSKDYVPLFGATGGLGGGSTTYKNDYTGESRTETYSILGSSTYRSQNAGQLITAGKYNEAFSAYNTMSGGLDRWITEKLKEKGDTGAAQRLEYLGQMRTKLGEIEQHNPTRMSAVFHPEDKSQVKEVPLAFYYWHDDQKWHLKDLTNPKNTYEDTVDFKGEAQPPDSLFAKLNIAEHFPKGTIHYQIPGGRGGQLKTTAPWSVSDWLAIIGLSVAAVGLGLVTFGTGTVAVAGAWVLAASSVIGAAGAAVHMAEQSEHGNLSTGEAALDIAMIAAGLLGASQIAAGRIVLSASAKSMAGAPWTGTAARIAGWADAAYVPLTVGRITGDTITVALASAQLVKQLEQIEQSGAPADEKTRLKALLLTQFAVTGGLVALSIKGDLPSLGKGRNLYVYTPTAGGPLVAAHMEPGAINVAFAADRWLMSLKSQLDPEALKRFDTKFAGKAPVEVMNTYRGNLDAALKELGVTKAAALPDTADRFCVGNLPKSGPARWKYLEDPKHWTPERAALHDRLIAAAKLDAQQFAEALAKGGQGGTLYAMRGNTAAGKTRAVTGNVPELAGPMAQTKDLPHRAVNPDNFKADLIKETPGATSTEVHAESSMLSNRLQAELLGMKTTDGKAGSMLIDKRLLSAADVAEYARLAKESGRKFVLYDVDAPLEVSLTGVLERAPGGADPLPPFDVVAGGFDGVRTNRAAVVALFEADATMGTYHLYGTRPNGDRVEIATTIGGKTTILDDVLYKAATLPPKTSLASVRITPEAIDAICKDLPADRAVKIREILQKYQGWTWKAALDAHSLEKPPQ